MKQKTKVTNPTIRCAIYTRKSSEEGLHQEFNSLDAQREAAEAYVASQKAEGWTALPERYDDGGYSGGNIERPALKRLLSDIEAGGIDCVIVYKVDRLSRSLMDFARVMQTFDAHKVSFVSVTQHFNTTHSMGRLTLNILLSFAQFEREIIGERIRDKIGASRRKGKWTGGFPILGYDVDRSNESPKLVVNAMEATRVRKIFELYLERGALLPVVAELEKRNWRTKAWSTRKGDNRGDLRFNKCNLYNLLTNVLYAGKVQHKDEIYPGEHEPIIADEVFGRVQARLKQNYLGGRPDQRNRHGALLRRLLYCKGCGKAMCHTYASKGTRRYRYYTCSNVIKSGRSECPTPSLPAGEIEKSVIEQIASIGRDPALIREMLFEARKQTTEAIAKLREEQATLEKGLVRCHGELRRAGRISTTRVAELNDQIRQAELRQPEIKQLVVEMERDLISVRDVKAAPADFANLWTCLSPREQVRVMSLLVERVEFDHADNTIETRFHPSGIKIMQNEQTVEVEEDAA